MARPGFLLDEQIGRRVAKEAGRRGVDVAAVDGSELAGLDDLALFRRAIHEGRIVVTYNNADFAPLMAEMLKEYPSIPGVVFVDRSTIPTSDVMGLVRALARLAERIEMDEVDVSGGAFLGRR